MSRRNTVTVQAVKDQIGSMIQNLQHEGRGGDGPDFDRLGRQAVLYKLLDWISSPEQRFVDFGRGSEEYTLTVPMIKNKINSMLRDIAYNAPSEGPAGRTYRDSKIKVLTALRDWISRAEAVR